MIETNVNEYGVRVGERNTLYNRTLFQGKDRTNYVVLLKLAGLLCFPNMLGDELSQQRFESVLNLDRRPCEDDSSSPCGECEGVLLHIAALKSRHQNKVSIMTLDNRFSLLKLPKCS
jgi:hypothetical protein